MNLINQRIAVSKEKCAEMAQDEFLKDSGLLKEGSKFDKMRRHAFEIRSRIEDRIDLKGIYSYYEDFSLEGRVLKIKDAEFTCNAFEQLDGETLKGVYIYLVTGGDYYLDDEPIMNQLYADIWGTAFAEVTRIYISQQMSKGDTLSDSFGPGFYGMPTIQMKELPKLLDNNDIGVEIRDSGILIPLKSCGGILFNVNENYKKLESQCVDCRGSSVSCSLCSFGRM